MRAIECYSIVADFKNRIYRIYLHLPKWSEIHKEPQRRNERMAKNRDELFKN